MHLDHARDDEYRKTDDVAIPWLRGRAYTKGEGCEWSDCEGPRN